MAINPLGNYASQQINNPFTARSDEQARINDRDQDRQREATETRRSGTEAAETQQSEARNNGSSQNRDNEVRKAADTRSESTPPRSQERGSVLDISV